MARILVLEDEPGIALPLEDALKLEGYEVELVSNGLTAAERARRNSFDLILLDVTVPGQSGFDVCRELRRSNVRTPIIFLSARAQERDRVFGLDLGAHDYVVKPFSVAELMARVRTTLRHAAETREDRGRIEREVRAASEVQRRLLPQHKPAVSGLDYAAVCRPATDVSGDYFDFLPLEGGRLGLLVADVCGKGMPAALLAASLHATVRAYAVAPGSGCAEVLSRANRLLFETTSAERYVTVFFAIYDPAARSLTYANAGHYPPWIIAGSQRHRLDSLTPPLGMFPEIPRVERTVAVAPGQWLLVASDGIPEACSTTSEEFGDERLLTLIDGDCTATTLCDAAIDAVTAFSEGHKDSHAMTSRCSLHVSAGPTLTPCYFSPGPKPRSSAPGMTTSSGSSMWDVLNRSARDERPPALDSVDRTSVRSVVNTDVQSALRPAQRAWHPQNPSAGRHTSRAALDALQ